jgi:uncharacterized membrane protein (UPF0127 family)/CheY-like chemotaxis protein
MEKGRGQLAAKTKLIVNLTRGECLCVSELAERPLPRMRGLLGRRGLPAGEGMLLRPAPSIHTAFMRFPIDALFLDRELRVLDIRESLVPWRFAAKSRARAVLELAAGECARRMVQVGDRLELRDRSPVGAAENGKPFGRADASAPGSAAAAARESADLARLQPMRVLILSPDHHFRSVMSLLLARRNCSVTTTANAARVHELVVRESPDVAVIDASEPAVAATVAMVDTLAQPVGLVLVGELADTRPDGPSILAKWGPFEGLLAAIEQADARRGT